MTLVQTFGPGDLDDSWGIGSAGEGTGWKGVWESQSVSSGVVVRKEENKTLIQTHSTERSSLETSAIYPVR